MYKKSPKNQFKLSSFDIPNSSSSSSSSSYYTHKTPNQCQTQQCTLGLCYYNYFSLPKVDIAYSDNGNYEPLNIVCRFNQDNATESAASAASAATSAAPTTTKPYISASIYSHLCDMKEQIEQFQEEWDNIKKFTNPYEFIHTNITLSKTNISKLRPLSRSFYKMIEIATGVNLLDKYSDTVKPDVDYHSGIRTFHLAEGPGGFIEAISYLRGLEYEKIRKQSHTNPVQPTASLQPTASIQILKRNTEFHDEYMKEIEHNKISKRIFEKMNQDSTMGTAASTTVGAAMATNIKQYSHLSHEIYGNDRYYGMTLINDDPICPGWKKTKTFLDNNPNVIIEIGEDKTGNLLSLANFQRCASLYKNKMDIITADGGFDFSLDFNNQENIATRLILAEVFFALAMQKKGGSFILKIFDIFHKSTVDILYLLSYYYSDVSVIKPYTSRIANSEKYVICQGFKLGDSSILIDQICRVFTSCLHETGVADSTTTTTTTTTTTVVHAQIASLLERHHDLFYLNKIEEMNAILSFQQIENISSTLSIITSYKNAEKIEQYKKQNIQKCIHWCERYNIPYFKQIAGIPGGNIFLHR